MLVYHILNYKVSFSPTYAFQLLNHMWATEPVGATSIIITGTSVLLTLLLKMLDIWRDIYKERARQGKLKIELSAVRNVQGQVQLKAVISNTGREPIVVRDIGYAQSRLLGHEFTPVPTPEAVPQALNARELMHLNVSESAIDLSRLVGRFCVRDSLGKIWEAPDAEIRKAKKQLKCLAVASDNRGSQDESIQTVALSSSSQF